MANEALKEKEALLGSIQSITERTVQLEKEYGGILNQTVSDKTKEVEAAMKASNYNTKQEATQRALVKLDAVRAIQAKAIADGTLDQFEAQKQIDKVLSEGSKIQADVYRYIEDQGKKLVENTKEMQELDMFGESFADRLKEANDQAKENSATMKDVLNSAGLIVDELASVRTLIMAAVAGLAVATKEGFKLARALGEGSTAMDTMRIVGVQLESQARALTRGFALSGDEARSAMTALVGLNGTLKDATAEAVTTVGELSVKYGIAFDDAAALNKTMALISQNGQEGADAMKNQVKNLAKASGVAPGPVMKDIAENSMEFARFGKDGASGLVNAAVNAKKLGLNLEKVVAAGDSLLDVQGSIQKEMKAEMMIGRQLNLDAARAAALSGDRDTLVKEIARNAGTMAEFEQMSVVQQRALADALGVQVGDVTKVLQAKQKGITLDSKVLDAQSAQKDASDANAMAMAGVGAAAANLPGLLMGVMPALAGMKQVFGGLIPKGGLFGKVFSTAGEEATKLGSTVEKVKAPKGDGMSKFFKGLSKIKTSSMIKAALAIAIVAVALIPAAYAFSLLEGVNPVAMLVFGATMVGLALALSVVAGAAGPLLIGAAAFGIAAVMLIPAAYAMSLLAGVDPGSILGFSLAMLPLALGMAAMGALAPAIFLGVAVLYGLSKVLPFATAGFGFLSGVDGAALMGFGLMIMPLAIGLAAFGALSPAIALGTAALLLVSAVLPLTTIGLAKLGGVDPAALTSFVKGITPLGLGLALFGALSPAILLGAAALMAVSLVLPFTTGGLAALGGVDPAIIMTFANALIPLSLGVAAFGVIAPLAILAAVAMAAVGGAVYIFAKAFSLMAGVDPKAIGILRKGIKSMIGVVEDIGLIQGAKLVAKAVAIGAVGLAVLPFGKAISLAGKGDATGLLKAVKGFAKIDTGGLTMAGIGMMMLSIGFTAFIPVFPFMGMMAESLALMIPQLAILAPLGEQLVMAGFGMMGLGYGMLPFGIGLMIAAPFIPLMPLLAEGILLMTPPLIELSTIAAIMPLMGFGMMMIGYALNILGMGLMMVFPFQAVLPILAQALIDMQPPLSILAPLGPQIMYLAHSITALGFAMGFAFYPVFAFGMAAYFTAPAVYLLGEASKVLGAGLEAVRVPLLAMAQQFPMILGLSFAITSLGASLLFATPGVFAFGAGAWFAMVPVMALAAGLSLMVTTAGGLTAVGTGLSSIAAGLAEVSEYKGTIAMLAIAAPALALLGGTGLLGGIGGGGGNNEEGGGSNGALIAKIDELIAVVNSKDYEPVLAIDGRKVGQATARKRGPRGMGD